MKIIKTREFWHLDRETNDEFRAAISIVQTYCGFHMFYDFKCVERGDTMNHAFLNRTTMPLEEAEKILKIKSDGYLGMGYTEVKE